jgi:DNA-binding transcriptional LysR family regulator
MSGSLSSAARQLNTSQPNITRLISHLERKLGYRLFIRRSRGVSPTAEAEILYDEVERSYRGLAEITRAAEEIGQYKNAHLTIGAMAAPLLEIVPEAVGAWSKQFGDLSITVQLRLSEHIIHWTRARRFDLGLVSPSYDVRDVNIITRRRLSYVLLGEPGSKLLTSLGERPVDIGELGKEPLIVPGLAYFLAITRDPEVRSAVQQNARIDGYLSFHSAQFAVRGLGIAIVDPITARYYSRMFDAVIRPLVNAPPYDLALIAPLDPIHARAAVEFGAFVTQAIDRIAGPLEGAPPT